MADTTMQQRDRTRVASGEDPPSPDGGLAVVRRRPGLVSVVSGAAGIVAAILPGLGLLALALAAVSIAAGVPGMRRGPAAACFPHARTGVVLGMIAVLLGFLSLGMQLLS